MVQPLPESVKTSTIVIESPQGALAGFRYPLTIAPDEVMVLLAIDYWWHCTLAAGTNIVQLALWAKSDSNNPGSITASGNLPDMIWSRIQTIMDVAESIRPSDREYITLPMPKVLIRPPRLMVRSSTVTGLVINVRLWYVLREVSDAELAKLMVKDHA